MIADKVKITNCPDCGVKPGTKHVKGCDVARCINCGWQALSHMNFCDNPKGNKWAQIWTGIWPGVLECIEFGWYAKFSPGKGWEETDANDPDGSPDLNRLFIWAMWSKEEQRYVKRSQPYM
jgi:hypothetical protein